MQKITINTPNAPRAIGPYAQAIKVGTLVFTSGQIPIQPTTGEVVRGDVTVQARQAFDNVKEILEASGSSLANTIKATVFLKDLNQFSKMNEIFELYFGTNKPARSCVEVARLPYDVDIEIEVVAVCAH